MKLKLSRPEQLQNCKAITRFKSQKALLHGFLFCIAWIILTGLWSSPALSAENPKPPFPVISLPEMAQGEKAIQALAGKLPEVAAWYGMSSQEFAKIMREDPNAWLDKKGRLLYIDEFPEPAKEEEGAVVEEGPFPYSETFLLHSRPGSNRVIFLDFDGHTVSGTAWNNSYGDPIVSPAYSMDSDRTTFTNTEKDRIQRIWQRVAEDFAPFDVDVTTEDPGQAAITRSSSGDNVYGTRVVITIDDFANCGCGGFAYVGVFDNVGDYYKPNYVFNGGEVGIAEAASHEVGHNLGLSHDGVIGGSAYYSGHGSGATGWAPIMGVGYNKQLVQWSKGEYLNANQTQDDIQIIHNNGALLMADDHSDIETGATALGASSNGTTVTLSGDGLIERRADIDVFQFLAGSGDFSISVNPAPLSPNLDIKVELYDDLGNLIASSNPADSLPALINETGLPAGEYFLMVEGVGKGDPLGTGYTDYGSLGVYSISGSIPDPGGLQPPNAVATTNTLPGPAPHQVDFIGSGSTDDGSIVGYDWDFGDGSPSSSVMNPSHIYNSPGNFTATLTVTDNDGLTDSDTENIIVVNQPPMAMASAGTTSGTAPLEVTFSSAGSTDLDGTIESYSWDFGDGNNSSDINPTHTYNSAGTFIATLTVTDDLGGTDSASTDPIVVDPPPFVDQYATSDIFGSGTVTGNYTNTHANEGSVESIRERESGGKPSKRHSYLEHVWTFNVQPGNMVTLFINAWTTDTSDNEEMVFAYSTNGGSSYTDVLTINNTSDVSLVSVPLPFDTQGNVRIRVRDTDRSQGNRSLDTVYIDEMFIQTENQPGTAPNAPTNLGAVAVSSGQVDLDWIQNSGDEYGFRIERSDDGGSTFNLVDTVGENLTAYSDVTVSPNSTYTYRTAAYNGSGQSAYSNQAVATTPDDPGSSITLSANGYKVKGVQHADLTWSGADSVDVYRDNFANEIDTTSTSPYTDNIGNKGGGSYTYQVCEAGTSNCSDPVNVIF